MAEDKNKESVDVVKAESTEKKKPKKQKVMAKIEVRDMNARFRVKKKRGGHMLITIDQLDNPHIVKQLIDSHVQILKEGKGISQRRK